MKIRNCKLKIIMKLIVGLGNPEEKYDKTRHNVGFMALDKFAKSQSYLPWRLEGQFHSRITQKGGIGQTRIILAKPGTYMNLSGEAIKKIMSYYKIGFEDLWVICDDIDLPLGSIRVREEGSAGGHKGLQSIIDQIKDNRFVRIRIGIGSNRAINMPSERYVLQKFNIEEQEKIEHALDQTVNLLVQFLKDQVKEQTIRFN